MLGGCAGELPSLTPVTDVVRLSNVRTGMGRSERSVPIARKSQTRNARKTGSDPIVTEQRRAQEGGVRPTPRLRGLLPENLRLDGDVTRQEQ